MVKHTLKTMQQMLQNFKSLYDHFGTLCITVKGYLMNLKTLPSVHIPVQ